ncbi:histidine kinase [Maricaulis sp.]|uniref:sensor histidine kinase n=1 Tax=Maricaulis sp. TaxID=1486257 RepID=UPI0025BF3ABD|nr:histidine kinase [Maricaulis sp.]
MLRLLLVLLLVLGPPILLAPGGAAAQSDETPVVWRAGDDPGWSQPDLDTGDWQALAHFAGAQDGRFWIRARLDAPGLERPVLSIRSNAAYEVFLDGQRLGGSGRPGVPGNRALPELVRVGVPASLLDPGRHVLAFRMDGASLVDGDSAFLRFRLDDAAELARADRRRDAMDGAAALLAGFLLLTAAGIWIWGTRRVELVMVVGLCAGAILIFLLDTDGRAFATPLLPRFAAAILLTLASAAIYALTAAIIHRRLGLGRPRFWAVLAGMCLVVALLPLPFVGMEGDQRAFILLALLAVGMSLSAWPRRRLQAAVYAGAALVCLVAILLFSGQLRIFLALLVVLISVSMIVDVVMGEINMRRAELRASRLQAALVKRNIQPHFIMNSLTVAMELQETDAAAARDFIRALSEEFRALASMIDKPRVTLREELDLCRSHLAMMALRLEAQLTLETSGLDEAAECPPGLFHTLIENAISHNRYQGQSVTLTLSASRERTDLTYSLRAPLLGPRVTARPGSGSGTRYIEARLEEFAPGRWTFSSAPEGDVWVSRVRIVGGLA